MGYSSGVECMQLYMYIHVYALEWDRFSVQEISSIVCIIIISVIVHVFAFSLKITGWHWAYAIALLSHSCRSTCTYVPPEAANFS